MHHKKITKFESLMPRRIPQSVGQLLELTLERLLATSAVEQHEPVEYRCVLPDFPD